MTTAPEPTASPDLEQIIRQRIRATGGWMGFEEWMAQVLYEPGLGYYSNGLPKFGHWPGTPGQPGSDFVTAPELSPWFGRAVARQVDEALQRTGTDTVWEFGAGSGALAQQLLQSLPPERLRHYRIVDLSGSLRQRQRETLAEHGDRVLWLDRLPTSMNGVVLGNELLDAIPVRLLARRQGQWMERGVGLDAQGAMCWAERPSALRPPLAVAGEHDYLTEIHPHAEAFVRTLADHLRRGMVLLIDYGFPEREYYHPERHMGTLTCHQQHRSGGDPLRELGQKDITAHVNFTGLALAAQEAGWDLLGYTSQGRFLINCGLLQMAEGAPLAERVALQKLVNEHEMGELFKVMALVPGDAPRDWQPLGFAVGDRSHSL